MEEKVYYAYKIESRSLDQNIHLAGGSRDCGRPVLCPAGRAGHRHRHRPANDLYAYYELRDDYLYCRSGPFFEKIAYERIKSVRLYHSHLSSLALSAQQIEIRQHNKSYITGTTLISPENREEFLEELRSRCQNLDAVDSKQ
jgi:hypothetical protein